MGRQVSEEEEQEIMDYVCVQGEAIVSRVNRRLHQEAEKVLHK